MGSLDIFRQLTGTLTSDPPLAWTTNGQVEGVVEQSRSGLNYYAFKGIPYAKPPVGDLRFAEPVAPDNWNGVRPAKRNPIFCIQLFSIFVPLLKDAFPPMGSEDCLYLSVGTRSVNPKSKRPVLVYLHGGAFIGLAGPSFYKPTFLMDSDIVVVMANYRLTLLGFLSFEDDVLPGNLGLKDQHLALKWVQENIENFGGDPNRVTIMGESAGGASVHYHAISPMGQDLFHQVIPLSGSAYALWAYAYPGDARKMAFQYGKYLGCHSNSSSVVVDCLKKISAYRLIKATPKFYGAWDLEPHSHIGPVFEKKRPGSFVPSSAKKFKPINVPMLVGETPGEGLLKTLFYKSILKGKSWNWISKNWNDALPFSLRFLFNPRKTELTEKLRQYWFNGRPTLHDSDLANFTELYTVIGLTSPQLRMVEVARNDVYYFRFNYLGELSPSLMVYGNDYPKLPFHAEYVIYILHAIFLPAFDGQDLQVSRNLTKMITNFVIYGDPTPDSGLWTPWTPTGYDTLEIDNNGMHMIAEGLPKHVNFSRSLCLYDIFFGCTV